MNTLLTFFDVGLWTEILESVYLGVLKDPANDLEISSLLDEILLDCKKFDENNKNKISSELDSNVTSCPE